MDEYVIMDEYVNLDKYAIPISQKKSIMHRCT